MEPDLPLNKFMKLLKFDRNTKFYRLEKYSLN